MRGEKNGNHFSREEKWNFRYIETSAPWDHHMKILIKVSIGDDSFRRHAQVGHRWRHYSKWKWKKWWQKQEVINAH